MTSPQFSDSLVSVTFTEDPACIPQGVESLRFEGVTPKFLMEAIPKFKTIENWRLFEGLLLAVVHWNGDLCRVIGSAVVVAPGVALAATHVVRNDRGDGVHSPNSLTCIGITRHGALAWRVRYMAHTDRTDVCILGLTFASAIPDDQTFFMASITTRTPKLDERLVTVGFHPGSKEFEMRDGTLDLEAGILLSSGRVVGEFHTGRGRSKPWPSLEVECPTVGAMSGGAVFDSRGFLVGLISSGLDRGLDGEPALTWVALLWPMLGQRFLGGWPVTEAVGKVSTLLGLGARCRIERPEAVRVRNEGSDVITDYDAWS